MKTTDDQRIFSPSTARNKEPIYLCLEERLPESGTILEIASGSGEHAAFFSPLLPRLNWQPTNLDEQQLQSARSWRNIAKCQNILEVLRLDATESTWPVEQENYAHGPIAGLFNANMIHIAPWQVCEGLFAGAGRVLNGGGALFLYGPFKIDGKHTSDSNIQFEKWLTDQNPEFGVRDIEKVSELALANGLEHIESCIMPSNNFVQVFKKKN